MARNYTLGKRADQQAQTRQRIVEAAVELHGTIGPAATSFSMLAERAGVQRHTLYAHFPDERSLLLACSAHALESDPTPGAASWASIADRRERLEAGLGEIYAWYARNAQLMACVLRDAEHHEPVREIMTLRYGASIAAWHEVLGGKLRARQRAMLHLALAFHTWRALVGEAGLKPAAAVKLMVQAIEGAEER